jgi:hypothetical protein
MKAIDVHVHPGLAEDLAAGGEPMADAMRVFREPGTAKTVDELAAEYRALDAMAVLLGWPGVPNEFIAGLVARHPERFIGFGCVNPADGARAVDHCASLGLRGLKFHPIAQRFFPDDAAMRPIYEACVRHKLVVLFHTGHTALGAGARGGRGLRLTFARPIHLDDVAAEFPGLDIVAAHGGWPWTDELLSVALHKSNVWLDLSGWPPTRLPESLVRHANGALADRVLFGSDHPFLRPAAWLEDFARAPFKPEVRPKILVENAKRLLRL